MSNHTEYWMKGYHWNYSANSIQSEIMSYNLSTAWFYDVQDHVCQGQVIETS
jgi:hypothetical protein